MNNIDNILKDERCWTVYIHTNKINNKRYVGITSKEPKHRWGMNGNGYKNQPFHNAIKKYGWGSFDHEIIASNLTCEEANNFEMVLIRELDSHIEKNGYNTTLGGKGTKGCNVDRSMYTYENGANVKSVICLNNLQVFSCVKQAMEEYKTDNIGKCCKGIQRYKSAGKDSATGEKLLWAYYDDTKDDDYYISIREEKIKSVNHNKNKDIKMKRIARKVICLNNGIVFDSIKIANKLTNTKAISQSCRFGYPSGKDENGNKLYWAYLDEYEKTNNERVTI